MPISERELSAHFGNRNLTLMQRYRLNQLAAMRRAHELLMDHMQAGRSDEAYDFAKLLAHLAHKLHGDTK